jgi:hypothetical protein
VATLHCCRSGRSDCDRNFSPESHADVVFRAAVTPSANVALRSIIDWPRSSRRECDRFFLVALESLIDRRRITALNTQIGELTDRLVTLEGAESRRLAIKVRTKTQDVGEGPAKDIQRTSDRLQSPPLSVARLSEFSPTREISMISDLQTGPRI